MTDINGSDRLKFGPYEVDLHTHELWKHGTKLKLVGQPFEILALLVRRPGQLVTREELRSQLWPGDTFVDFNHGLNAAVNKLRDALCDSADDPKYIETLPRRGYRFLAQVEVVVPDSDPKTPIAVPIPQWKPALSGAAAGEGALPDPVLPDAAAFPTLEAAADLPTKKRKWLRLVLAFAALFVVVWFSSDLIDRFHSTRAEMEAKGEKLNAEKEGSGHLFPLTNLPDPTSDAAFSPDGNRVAFRREGNSPQNSGIFVKPLNSSQLIQLTDHAEDCCPVWSPDGTQVAFSRFSGTERVIYSVPSTGGPLRKLYATSGATKRGDLDWSPDGREVAFVGESAQGTSSIFMLSMKDLSAHRITQPPALNHDWGPRFSPDGQTLAFVRTHETGLPDTIVVMPSEGGESRVVIDFHNGILGPPAWAADGQSIIFAVGDEPQLLRVPAFGEPTITDCSQAGSPAWRPAVSRSGNRLAFQMSSKAVSVWQSDLTPGGKVETHRVVVTDAGRNEGAQVSPDDTKLAFMSTRSGAMEIWVSNRDGSDPVRLTWMGGAGTPHWSPDGRTISFDANVHGHVSVYIVSVAGGPPHPVVLDNFNNQVPNWSQDGEWIYFASDRTGMWQVWKVPSQGGSLIQVTTHGGFAAHEFNTVLYYSKLNMPSPEIWKIPVEGGVESRVSPLLRPETWASWAPVPGGFFFVQAGIKGEPAIMFLDSDRGQVSQLGTLVGMPFWFTASPDGKSVLYEHLDQDNSHIMLVNDFR